MFSYNQDKVDEMVLALMYLTSFEDEFGTFSWKGYDWDSLKRLHEKGLISNPVGKAKSVALSPEGKALMEKLFELNFAN